MDKSRRTFIIVSVLCFVALGFYILFDKADSNHMNCYFDENVDGERVQEWYSVRYDNDYNIKWVQYSTNRDMEGYRDSLSSINGVSFSKTKGTYKYVISVDYRKLDDTYEDLEFLQKKYSFDELEKNVLKEFRCEQY